MSRGNIYAWVGLVSAAVAGCHPAASAAIVSDGLILHLDAAAQVGAGGAGPDNKVWSNLAQQPDSVAGSGVLHNFGFDSSSGWTGSGLPGDPYALRFDGQKAYVEGPGNLELSNLTIESWALVRGVSGDHGRRGATLIGNDFGKGGISVLVSPSGSLMLLHGATHSPVPVDVPLGQWVQLVAAVENGRARFYVNGSPVCALPIARDVQSDHHPAYQLGTARFADMDYAACDALIGEISIVRVYSRALSSSEVRTNFEADSARIGVSAESTRLEPVSSIPVPNVPGLDPAASGRCMKWDYYYQRPHVFTGESPDTGIQYAFDGYPTSVTQPYPATAWRAETSKPDQPPSVTIDYKRPVAVTRFIHYFDRFRAPAAWQDVEVLASDDLAEWRSLQIFSDLPPDCPQVLGIDSPVLSRYYRITVRARFPGGDKLATYEIETYYGATVGNVSADPADPVQSEPATLSVRVVSPDTVLKGASLKLVAPKSSFRGDMELPLAAIPKGGSSIGSFVVTPLRSGPVPLMVELWVGKQVIDKRPCTVRVAPKLVLRDVVPSGAEARNAGDVVALKGSLVNAGIAPASEVKVTWMGKSQALGDLAPGQSAAFGLTGKVKGGYNAGVVQAKSSNGAITSVRRSVVCRNADPVRLATGAVSTEWTAVGDGVRVVATRKGLSSRVTGNLSVLAAGKPIALHTLLSADSSPMLAGQVPGGVLLIRIRQSDHSPDDPALEFAALPDDPNPLEVPWLDLEVRLAVDDPKVMFRPHIDWYTAEHGPNFPTLTNGHNSATRMLCVETKRGATVSIIPDTDNMTWGFTNDHAMTASFQIPLAPYDPLETGMWRPIHEAPSRFTITLPVRRGDWWDAYRHVVEDIFRFEEPRQWAVPLTQMQMLAERCLMGYAAWSEKWQTVRSFTTDSWFMNFYGAQFTLPALYSWYLATDDPIARIKAEKIADWLLNLQHNEGPMAGAWFSIYYEDGGPRLVGGDFIRNRWLIPQSTGATVRTLLWYWNASGRKDGRLLSAAKRGCDWMLKTLRDDGGWPYAFDLDGNRITDQCGAGQIWCTWALWMMYGITGDQQYKDAAIRSKDFFKKNYMDVHRYVGYWEDTVGITKEQNKVIHSWESYEAALAALAFSAMGDKALAVQAARDLATHSWTRVTSTRQYETSLGETTEQSLCGPSQAQSPMVGAAFKEVYRLTGDTLWNDLAGATKAVNFCADPERGYAFVATSGWNDPLHAVAGPPYENVRPFVTPDMSRGDYGRQIWFGWCTDQFAWLALDWLMREGNTRAPNYVNIDLDTLRGTVLGAPGRIKMPEERCDITGIDHYDINWVGYQNDRHYALLVMNHKERVRVMLRPHEAHMDVYTRPPKVLVGSGDRYREVKAGKQGVQYVVDIPEKANALFIWDRIK